MSFSRRRHGVLCGNELEIFQGAFVLGSCELEKLCVAGMERYKSLSLRRCEVRVPVSGVLLELLSALAARVCFPPFSTHDLLYH